MSRSPRNVMFYTFISYCCELFLYVVVFAVTLYITVVLLDIIFLFTDNLCNTQVMTLNSMSAAQCYCVDSCPVKRGYCPSTSSQVIWPLTSAETSPASLSTCREVTERGGLHGGKKGEREGREGWGGGGDGPKFKERLGGGGASQPALSDTVSV